MDAVNNNTATLPRSANTTVFPVTTNTRNSHRNNSTTLTFLHLANPRTVVGTVVLFLLFLLHLSTGSAVEGDVPGLGPRCTAVDEGVCRPEKPLVERIVMPEGFPHNNSVEACCQHCWNNPKCVTWIYNSDQNACYLRAGLGTEHWDEKCTSGFFLERKNIGSRSHGKYKVAAATKHGIASTPGKPSNDMLEQQLQGALPDNNDRPVVCFDNLSKNPRTASIYHSGLFNRYVFIGFHIKPRRPTTDGEITDSHKRALTEEG